MIVIEKEVFICRWTIETEKLVAIGSSGQFSQKKCKKGI